MLTDYKHIHVYMFDKIMEFEMVEVRLWLIISYFNNTSVTTQLFLLLVGHMSQKNRQSQSEEF